MRLSLYILFCLFLISADSSAQVIPYGDSMDSVLTPKNNYYNIFYYKPAGYDSLNGPILWTIHGQGWTGDIMRDGLKFMADNRKALIVSPSMQAGYHFGFSAYADTTLSGNVFWHPPVFKEIYKHILTRENRDSIPVYLTGWSGGAQCVTRYMLIRQAFNDSIPIQMASSVNPCFYTFCTDSLQGVSMPYPGGLNGGLFYADSVSKINVDFICDEHVKSYYNENYAVMIGTADFGCSGTPTSTLDSIMIAQGANRYERAQNFYAFSDSDAVARGTVLKWQYAEVPGIGHDAWAMYGAKADTADTSTIAETLLFDSPYYPPTVFPPSADFTWAFSDSLDSLCNTVQFSASCALNRFPNTLSWDFGNGSTSTLFEPFNTYFDSGTYDVTLIISNSTGSGTLTQTVTIDNPFPVQPVFSADTTYVILPNATVQFSNITANATSYLWDFGDGSTSTDVNPVYQYAYADTFTISLWANDDSLGCSNTLVREDYIVVTEGTSTRSIRSGNQIMFEAYPNPFNQTTIINFALKNQDHVVLAIYNYMGQSVLELYSDEVEAGRLYSAEFDAAELSPGLYYCIMRTDRGAKVLKLTVVK